MGMLTALDNVTTHQRECSDSSRQCHKQPMGMLKVLDNVTIQQWEFSDNFWQCHNLPMGMLRQHLEWLAHFTGVPELDSAVITTSGQVILFVRIEVKVTDKLAMGWLDCIHLAAMETKHKQLYRKKHNSRWYHHHRLHVPCQMA